jgi:hypothetical protein
MNKEKFMSQNTAEPLMHRERMLRRLGCFKWWGMPRKSAAMPTTIPCTLDAFLPHEYDVIEMQQISIFG